MFLSPIEWAKKLEGVTCYKYFVPNGTSKPTTYASTAAVPWLCALLR
jgi:hypothetical protein